MGIRDEEIARMVKYANGLGIKVSLIKDKRRAKKTSNYGDWTNNPPEINIYIPKHNSSTQIILSFLHELAHHIYWIHNEKPEIPDAYILEDERKRGDPPIPKSERKKILEYERAGINYMKTIATELDLKIPMWKVELAQLYDLWVYEYYHEHGESAPKALCKSMFQNFKKVCKP